MHTNLRVYVYNDSQRRLLNILSTFYSRNTIQVTISCKDCIVRSVEWDTDRNLYRCWKNINLTVYLICSDTRYHGNCICSIKLPL